MVYFWNCIIRCLQSLFSEERQTSGPQPRKWDQRPGSWTDTITNPLWDFGEVTQPLFDFISKMRTFRKEMLCSLFGSMLL